MSLPDWIYNRLPEGLKDRIYERAIRDEIFAVDNGTKPRMPTAEWHHDAVATANHLIDMDNAERDQQMAEVGRELETLSKEPHMRSLTDAIADRDAAIVERERRWGPPDPSYIVPVQSRATGIEIDGKLATSTLTIGKSSEGYHYHITQSHVAVPTIGSANWSAPLPTHTQAMTVGESAETRMIERLADRVHRQTHPDLSWSSDLKTPSLKL